MLIHVPRHRADELKAWERQCRVDPINAASSGHRRRVLEAQEAIRLFLDSDHTGYCGVSWGKDSVCVASMLVELAATGGPTIPLVWVVVPGYNPDCLLVRDEWLQRFSHPYDEIHVSRGSRLTSEVGFREAAAKYGDRHISGVRADESRTRRIRARRWGHSTDRTCAPLSRWSGADVFAYLHTHDLPVHPAYAMNMHGALDRERIRVSSLGGERGVGMGRREWENRYYPTKWGLGQS